MKQKYKERSMSLTSVIQSIKQVFGSLSSKKEVDNPLDNPRKSKCKGLRNPEHEEFDLVARVAYWEKTIDDNLNAVEKTETGCDTL